MRTSKEYLARLAAMRPNIYLDGECIDRADPRVIKCTAAMCKTFDLADDPKYNLTAESHLSGKTINRFTHIHQSKEDLLLKQDMTRKLTALVGGCIQRCMGTDVMNALSVITKSTDIKYNTNYYERWEAFCRKFQEEDLVVACAQTDSKGDRSLRPADQPDPDQYLHVVERRPDGVVVRGAKLHNTMAPYADEIIAIPTRALAEDEKDYAIGFAIPADAEGVYLISRAAYPVERAPGMEAPITELADLESFTVFDDVFIPNERIFVNGETEFGSLLAHYFALYHRHSYCGCKPGTGDVLIGAAALVADYQGIQKKEHVREKLAEMISVAELVYAAGIAAAVNSTKAPSGTQIPDTVFCNVGRRHAGHHIYDEYRTLCDLAGGLPATLPLSKEYMNPEISRFVQKYTARREGISPEDHYRAFHLASDLLTSELSGVLQVAGVHGGGSPIMEDIAIMSVYNLEAKKKVARHLAGIRQPIKISK